MKALMRDPKDRYAWCSEMNADLRKFLGGQDAAFTNKQLSEWLRRTFAAELSREQEQMEEYKRIGRDALDGDLEHESDIHTDVDADVDNQFESAADAATTSVGEEGRGKRRRQGPGASEDAPTAVFGEISPEHLEDIKRQLASAEEEEAAAAANEAPTDVDPPSVAASPIASGAAAEPVVFG